MIWGTSRVQLLKRPAHKLTWTYSLRAVVLGQQLKRFQALMGGSEMSGIRASGGGEGWGVGSFLSDRSTGRDHCSFSEAFPNRAGRQSPHLSLHQPVSHYLPYPGNSLRSYPTQFVVPPKLFPVAFPYEWPGLAQASHFPKSSQTSSIWLQCAL